MSYSCNIQDLPFEENDSHLIEKIKRKFTMNGVVPDVTIYESGSCWINLDLDMEEKQRYELTAIRGLIDFEFFEEAAKEIMLYRSTYPFETDGMYEEAHLACAQGNIEDALALCQAIICDAPRHADTLALAGRILWDQGEIKTAKYYYNKVAEINAYEAQSYIRDLARSHNYEQAIYLSEQCLKQEEQNAYFHLVVARCYRAMQQYDNALDWALKGLKQTKSKSFRQHDSMRVLLQDFIEEMSVEIVKEKNLKCQLKEILSEIQQIIDIPVRLHRDSSLIPYTVSTLHIPNNVRSFYIVDFEEFDDAQGYSSALEQLLRLQLSIKNIDGDLRQLDYTSKMDAAYNKLFPSDTIGKKWTEEIDGFGEINVIDTGERQSEIDELHDMLMLCTIGLHLNERIYKEFPDFRTSQYLCLTHELARLVDKTRNVHLQDSHVSCTRTVSAIYANFVKRLYGYCDMTDIDQDDKKAQKFLKYYDKHRPTSITDYYKLIEYLGKELGIQRLVKWESSKWFLPLFHKVI